jgi:hypothetical protein
MLGHQGLLLILASRLALAGLVAARAGDALIGSFGLYGYGGGIGGAPVFYSNGKLRLLERFAGG